MIKELNINEVEAWLVQQYQQHADAFLSLIQVSQVQPWTGGEVATFSAALLVADSTVEQRLQRILIIDEQSLEPQLERIIDLDAVGAYQLLATELDAADFDLSQAMALQTVAIKKPWGQEVWFTGVEQRGVCSVVGGNDRSVLLPRLCELLPSLLLGQSHGELVLLKILDPLPTPVFGDLYFELHQKKQEVYVVTHVDESAWPDGEGGIRFGFNPVVANQYTSADELKQAYFAAVKAYEKVRRQLDGLIDAKRQEQGYAPDFSVSREEFAQWEAGFDTELVVNEKQLRAEMENFINIRPLQVGDVVKVPVNTPHSLQHGVRTIEFQTPVYERMILSFAQKVLTQNHWDTESALAVMNVDEPEPEVFVELPASAGAHIERIVDFDDFEVRRVKLVAGAEYLHSVGQSYWLAMGVDGAIELNGKALANECAKLIPVTVKQAKFVNLSGSLATLLLAALKQVGA